MKRPVPMLVRHRLTANNARDARERRRYQDLIPRDWLSGSGPSGRWQNGSWRVASMGRSLQPCWRVRQTNRRISAGDVDYVTTSQASSIDARLSAIASFETHSCDPSPLHSRSDPPRHLGGA